MPPINAALSLGDCAAGIVIADDELDSCRVWLASIALAVGALVDSVVDTVVGRVADIVVVVLVVVVGIKHTRIAHSQYVGFIEQSCKNINTTRAKLTFLELTKQFVSLCHCSRLCDSRVQSGR